MKWLGLAVVLVAALHPSLGFATPCDVTVDVHLVDSRSHREIAGAEVSVGSQDGVTDQHGHFIARALCPGQYRIVAVISGFEPIIMTRDIRKNATLEIQMQAAIDGVIEIRDVAPRQEDMQSTSVISREELNHVSGNSFSDALKDVPGVAFMRSATGLAKPIIRGQFGRRIGLFVDGVRHRSQNWGLDHAPEIDPFVANSIAVIRGPAGVRLGTDALGGAIAVEPEPLSWEDGLRVDAQMVGIYPRGVQIAGRLGSASAIIPGLAWQIDGSSKILAATQTPEYLLGNTAAREWNAGATVGYRKGNAAFKLGYRFYRARLGVCFCLRADTLDGFYAQLERERPINADLYRQGFSIARPFQLADHHTALTRARWQGGSGLWQLTYAAQFDHRREYDVVRASQGPQFDFRLTSHDVRASWQHKVIHLANRWHLSGSVGLDALAQVHSYAGSQLLPNYTNYGLDIYWQERLVGHDVEVELGARVGGLYRETGLTFQNYRRLVNGGLLMDNDCSQGQDLWSCTDSFLTFASSLGVRWKVTETFDIKSHITSASRAPNPDEQYLNGTSPTMPVFGVGDPRLSPETVYGGALSSSLTSNYVSFEVSGYLNYIDDYIYFAPAVDASGQPVFETLISGVFPRFETRPVGALYWGVDGAIRVRPVKPVTATVGYSTVRARNRTDNTYLAFVPPDRASTTLELSLPNGWGFTETRLWGRAEYVWQQSRFDANADLAAPPTGYLLADAGLSAKRQVGDGKLTMSLEATNLLNSQYRDYTSLLRYFADQAGTQVWLRLLYSSGS